MAVPQVHVLQPGLEHPGLLLRAPRVEEGLVLVEAGPVPEHGHQLALVAPTGFLQPAQVLGDVSELLAVRVRVVRGRPHVAQAHDDDSFIVSLRPDGPLVERLGGQLGAVPEGPALGGEPLEEVGAEEGRGAVGQGRVERGVVGSVLFDPRVLLLKLHGLLLLLRQGEVLVGEGLPGRLQQGELFGGHRGRRRLDLLPDLLLLHLVQDLRVLTVGVLQLGLGVPLRQPCLRRLPHRRLRRRCLLLLPRLVRLLRLVVLGLGPEALPPALVEVALFLEAHAL